MQPKARIQAFFDEPTNTVTDRVSDPATRQAAVIAPVLDYDHRSGKACTASAARVLEAARSGDLTGACVLETHAHADHLSAAPTSGSVLAPRSPSVSTSAMCRPSFAWFSTLTTCWAMAASSIVFSKMEKSSIWAN